MKGLVRALALTGVLSLGAAAAQAQVRVFVGVRTPAVVAVPPCPGVGYIWTPGYYAGSEFVPGRWIDRGYDRAAVRDDHYDARYDNHRDFDRDRDSHRDHDNVRDHR